MEQPELVMKSLTILGATLNILKFRRVSQEGSVGVSPRALRGSLRAAGLSGNGLRVKTRRVKTSENFSEESNLPRRFRRYPEML